MVGCGCRVAFDYTVDQPDRQASPKTDWSVPMIAAVIVVITRAMWVMLTQALLRCWKHSMRDVGVTTFVGLVTH